MSSHCKSLRHDDLPGLRRNRMLAVLLAIGLGCGQAAAVAGNAGEWPTRVGKASFYSHKFAGRRMADGTPMQLHGNGAASLTLPLGTTARVTNMETGESAVVVVRDRGPHVRGRIIDVSPATARLIGITRRMGVARVEVAPIHVPGLKP